MSGQGRRRLRERPGGAEAVALLAVLVVVLGAWAFAALADAVREGDTQRLDERVLVALRQPDDPARPVGPSWLPQAARDLTALGSLPVLAVVTAVVIGFLLVRGRGSMAVAVLAAVAGGAGVSGLLKAAFQRGRPAIVPHLDLVDSSSFPSGHAMVSAVVYLTLAGLLAGLLPERRAKLYVLAVALALTAVVGATRVYLGVHYPSDVLAGWAAGLAWATACVLASGLPASRHRG